MNIRDLYTQATLPENSFQSYTGVSRPDFNALLMHFHLTIPRSMSMELRLFAILYAKQKHLDDKEIGSLLEYSSANLKKYGVSFRLAAIPCLDCAKATVFQAQSGASIVTHIQQKPPVQTENSVFFLVEPYRDKKTEVPVVDRAYVKEKIKTTFERIFDQRLTRGLFREYYGMTAKMMTDFESSHKWKTYLYLRSCILDYKRGHTSALLAILKFLENTCEQRWLADQLTDKPVMEGDEKWGSGSHEWLERCLITEALKRSAGLVKGVEAEAYFGDTTTQIDWLYLQAMIRSPTKYTFFKNDHYTIESGHPGAVKPHLSQSGFSSIGSPGFHQQLNDAFYESRTIEGFLKRVRNIFKSSLYSGKKKIEPSEHKRYLSDGSKTTELSELSLFRHNKLYPNGYNKFKHLLNTNIDGVTLHGKHVQENISEVSSETTDESMKEIVASRKSHMTKC